MRVEVLCTPSQHPPPHAERILRLPCVRAQIPAPRVFPGSLVDTLLEQLADQLVEAPELVEPLALKDVRFHPQRIVADQLRRARGGDADDENAGRESHVPTSTVRWVPQAICATTHYRRSCRHARLGSRYISPAV